MTRLYHYIAYVLITFVSYGQGKSALDLLRGDRQVANEFYEQLDFRNAIHFFEKSLEKKPGDVDSQFKIAKSYLQLNETDASEVWLRSLVSNPEADMEMNLLYAEVLRRNGKADLAKEWYARILAYEHNEEVASKLHFLNNISYYQRDSVYEIENFNYNSKQSDFSLQQLGDGLIFLSARQTERYIQHQPATASNEGEGMLRYFTIDSGIVNQLTYDEDLKPYFHDGPLSFFNMEKNVAFTRNDLRDSKKSKGTSRVNLKIFLADCSNHLRWIDITAFEHNSESYSVGHPALNTNGTVMFFSSDMPGGYGGADLYISYNYDGSWSTPENLGPTINTTGNELFPTIFNDTTLYFSSTGLGGFGGLDIFMSSFKNNKLAKPKNMGSPVNSISDDFSLTMDQSGRKGFFSSNRYGGHGRDDIYSFRTIMYAGVGKVITKQSGLPIKDAAVTINSIDGSGHWNSTTDSVGSFPINVPYDSKFRISIKKQGHSDLYSEEFSTLDTRINYDTLRLSLWEDDLYAKGKLYSNETQQLISDVKVTLEDLDNGVVETIITDESGVYEFALTPGTKYKISADHEGFIANGFSINTTNIFSGDLLNDILLEEEFVDKSITYFKFNASEIQETHYDELNQLIRTLKRFPESILNIAAHADARGTESYNKRLSQNRLNKLIRYFTSRGIPKWRIQGIAFGEELLLNKCSNGVECEEDDHSKNRRAELKVQDHSIH
ncbi:OmpA family protein [Ekhidna sp.]|uniref:OmpA family protein n=1 Tax=Ekhidna sp. TaxID=2608089 RepID=UPI00329A30FA